MVHPKVDQFMAFPPQLVYACQRPRHASAVLVIGELDTQNTGKDVS